ncbi:MAG: hypothetical protein R3C26_19215 [Calditrichia bacterium]
MPQRENARDNRLPNLQFICGDAADAMGATRCRTRAGRSYRRSAAKRLCPNR